MNQIESIDWEKIDGLIPVVTQEATTNEVLMLAFMDREALTLTLESNIAHYFSRSKQRIWKKGESSGHIQEVVDIMIDCDNDTILLKVNQTGVACHTGRKSCFFTSMKTNEEVLPVEVDTTSAYGVIDTLYHTIQEKKNDDPKKSYTAKLLQGEENSMLKKIVEESGEFTFAIKDNDSEEIIYEAADITYHVLVALASKNISPDRVKQELARRFGMSGIEEKNSRTDK
ncbi:bifunctional phosphoribosyl-AMP cyclohydrolase/phosphoribosyl-ATP diphosphatase HisIE [Poseidonibacter ostreae]|jgi:phosphoribosyl-AMP cyclohydrolase / phosphoribosyl-ATP pyrophosphohydrolase|uniref:Histidine biosynthesis bifunctional protein HisIE n=1 Tax=Poseidonibacter ostreae TaxID=2654171 RepID=A0A6L4WYA6_9BACT|nr:bifunctional phosphoribosyl-AMP cyclohydrolase/phosphoribosyl-ATP diphosphatase HisIE [Poseidonibacter ostreae]KAB7887639.1 bifunctional phosphoribosyl-AMP cyclohydrolase/phosphoribosyl-ATP diphosphatase HisIE [Poseidonibacter ostreae]KAB7890660.1 bifunctional phosphoribosyl-AMP cyclohydrolase/phosphoribosyl-ATP diphosphatase HisIE [Poseidonibacter ostreae]KAB7892357.1 bifunctional phosphoribosyl-AMP cyclohydrolase/phosphoribosyl-ATP diphosphatase HisIE [Poseidonibacter ostreae]MAC83283.1 bi|tara:strand:+ start:374 stop:1057 length:684 start_codon:yes stop_codon:yes gene_type:complete